LYEAADRRRTEQEAQQNAANESTYRAMFMFADPNQQYTTTQIMRLVPDVADLFYMQPNQIITSEQALGFFMTYFDRSNYLSPEQRRQIDTMFAAPAASSFATQTNQDVYTDLFARAEAGNLTVVGLNAARSSITPENYTTLLGKIGAEADDALVDAKRVVQLRFGYDAEMAMDTESAQQAQAAYFSVASQLEQMATTRRAEGNPMTRTELNQEAQRLAGEQLELFRLALRGDRDQYISMAMAGIPVGSDNPLADLDAWWNSLDAAQQRERTNDYARHRFTLLDYQNRMNR
jgi:hypothetical protein